MIKKYTKSLFVFRRDLRVFDNIGLNKCLTLSDQTIPCFILDPRQIEKNPYKSKNALQFLFESLDDLSDQIKRQGGRLYVFYGKAEEIIEQIIVKEKINAVFLNKDYTPFSVNRDDKIKNNCAKNNVDFNSCFDLLLTDPKIFGKDDGSPYTIFTPFFKRASMVSVQAPEVINLKSYFSKPISFELKDKYWKYLDSKNKNLAVSGGRKVALGILNKINNFEKYDMTRDFPELNATTYLSAHLKFGTVSVREVYYKISSGLSSHHPLLRQLYWRDFFSHIVFHFPKVLGNAFQDKFNNISWSDNKALFSTWCNGETGFPIVDAGMRELNTTGYMHNRVRMVVASFLTKDLHIDWRWGEKYFAQCLFDYDPALNNGNWQWAASTGCDAQPYFRIFNPWLQQLKFDKNCFYIKKWIPELRNIDDEIIHKACKNSLYMPSNYPKPVVDHSVESNIAKQIYADAVAKYLS